MSKWFIDIIGNQGIYKTRSLPLLMGEIVVPNKNLVITDSNFNDCCGRLTAYFDVGTTCGYSSLK